MPFTLRSALLCLRADTKAGSREMVEEESKASL